MRRDIWTGLTFCITNDLGAMFRTFLLGIPSQIMTAFFGDGIFYYPNDFLGSIEALQSSSQLELFQQQYLDCMLNRKDNGIHLPT